MRKEIAFFRFSQQFFKTESSCIAQASLELSTILASAFLMLGVEPQTVTQLVKTLSQLYHLVAP